MTLVILRHLKCGFNEVSLENIIHGAMDHIASYKKACIDLPKESGYRIVWNGYLTHCVVLILRVVSNIQHVVTELEDTQAVTTNFYNHNHAFNLVYTSRKDKVFIFFRATLHAEA